MRLLDKLTRAAAQPHDSETLRHLLKRAIQTGKKSGLVAGLYAERLWLTPWPTHTSESAAKREAAWMADATPFDVAFEGQVLKGFTAGEGPAVLFVPGWGEYAARWGAYIAPLRAAGLRAVSVSMPSHGPGATGITNVYQMSRAITAVAEQVGGLDAIVAHSMGVTASSIARRDGVRVRAVVALGLPTMRTEDAFEKFGVMMGLPPRALSGLHGAIERRFGAGTWHEVADVLGRHPNVPGLVMHDRDDPLVPLADAEAVARGWGVELEVTDNLGHNRILRESSVVDRVVGFLADSLAVRESDPR